MRVKLIVVLLLAAATIMQSQWFSVAWAQAPVLSPGIRVLVERMPVEARLDGFVRATRREFRWLDANSDHVLTDADREFHAAAQLSGQRTRSALEFMRADMDGDGIVTHDEVMQMARYDQRGQQNDANREKEIAAQVERWMALDTDNDSRITLAEALKSYQTPAIRPPGETSIVDRIQSALTLSPTQNGIVTLTDFENAATLLFQRIDINGDGTVSSLEMRDYRLHGENPGSDAQDRAARQAAHEREVEQERVAREAEARKGCQMPRVSDNGKIVLLSAYETDAISTATIGSQDIVVHAGNVVVEPGKEPLYVVIATYGATIWQFSGAVERIEQVVLSSMQSMPKSGSRNAPPAIGVTGIEKDKVSFLMRTGCINYFTEAPSRAAAAAEALIREETGKDISVIKAAYSVKTFAIPSGEMQPARKERRETCGPEGFRHAGNHRRSEQCHRAERSPQSSGRV